MPNYKITIQYDGTDFFGWQSQPSGNTIQDELQKSILRLTGEDVNLIGSGRTDSGVHAFNQVANFIVNKSLDEFKFKHSLNSILPSAIAVSQLIKVNDSFHARFDAKRRSYFYFIRFLKSPFYSKYSYLYPILTENDISRVKDTSLTLIGKHDFTSFCKKNTDTENKVCNVRSIELKKTMDFLIFKIEADRFLHGMVRTIIGTLLSSLKHNNGNNYVTTILESRDRETAGESVPANGLFLYKVKY